MLEEARTLAARGAYRAAWEQVRAHARPDPEWLDLRHFVAQRLGLDTERRVALRALRRAVAPNLRLHGLLLLEDLRVFRTFRSFERWRAGELPPAREPADERRWHLAVARLHSHLRDFERAVAAIARAEAAGGDHPLIELERAWILHDEDRRAEAIAHCRASIARWEVDGLLREQECWLLDASGSDEALPVLSARIAEIESPLLEASLAHRLFEAGELARAKEMAERTLGRGPTGRHLRRMLHALLLRIARSEEDDVRALVHARSARPPLEPWAAKLQAPRGEADAGRPSRVLHAVPFVRQDLMTCSPATMSSLLRSFGLRIEQREIAEKITYDGTPVHGEWAWAEARGLASCFFLFDAELARELIDRGLPFAVSLRGETWGHRLALCGYDRVLDTFLLRDPNYPLLQEVQREYLETYSASRGGICALLVPRELLPRVPERLLAEAAEWLDYVKMHHAFEERRLAEAEALAAGLLRSANDRLVWATKVKLAEEHRNERALLELAAERLTAQPEDAVAQSFHARALERAGRWHEHRVFLEKVTSKVNASAHLRLSFADAIRQHASERPRAERLVRAVLRQTANDAYAFRGLADILWSDPKRRAEATEIYRAAACLGPLDEGLARSYAIACLLLGHEAQGIDFLRARAERYAARSPQPALTLSRVLQEYDQPSEALALLEQNAARHATNPAAQLECFDALLQDGRIDAAAALFERAAALLRTVDRELASARLARARGDFPAVLASLARAASAEPPAPHAFSAYWNELFVQRGIDEARAAVEDLQARHGDDPPLMMEALAFYQRIEDREREGALLERLVREHPHEPWLREKLAQHAYHENDLAQLEHELEELERALPESTQVAALRAQLEAARGNLEPARTAIRRALEIRFDQAFTLRLALDLMPDPGSADTLLREARRRWLSEPRPPALDALQLWLEHADERFEKAEIESFLAELREAYPASFQIRLAAIERQLEKAPKEALAGAESLAADFPWDTAVLLLRARCLRGAHQLEAARARLEEMLARRPSSVEAYTLLGQCFEDEAQLAAARDAYRRGIARVPSSPVLQGYLAEVSWKLSDHATALGALARAHALDRDYAWAWDAHVSWLALLDRNDEALLVAEDCARTNPRWSLSFRLLARAYRALGKHEQHVEALRRALELQPRLGPERIRLIHALIENRRFDEARAAAQTGLALLGETEDLAAIEARILRAQGELAPSRASLREALRRHADSEPLWMLFLEWLEEEGLHEEILAIAQEPPPAIAEVPALQAYAADAWSEIGDADRAIQALRRALELAPEYDWARDRLAERLLERQAFAEVIALLGDDPVALTLARTRFVGCAAVGLRRRPLALACFERLLATEEVDPEHLRRLDESLSELDPIAQRRRVLELVTRGGPAPRVNALHLLAARGERAKFLDGLRILWMALDRARAERIVSRLCEAAVRTLGRKELAPWIARHVATPVADLNALGRFAYALPISGGSATMTRLFGADWRREGVQAWMLANLAGAWIELGELDRAEEVARFALEKLPRDHGFWWHRRYLAEIELLRGHPARCLEMILEPPAQLAAELVRTLVLALRAELALAPDRRARRRKLRELLPRVRNIWRRARQDEASEARDLERWKILRACPSWPALRYALLPW